MGTDGDKDPILLEALEGQTEAPETTSEEVDKGQNEYVSKAEFLAAINAVKRETQGLVDRNVSRLDKRVATATEQINFAIASVKATGLALTPEQENNMRQKAINDVLTQPPSAPPDNSEAALVTRMAQRKFERAGITLSPDDKEYGMIDTSAETPEDYLESVDRAIAAYTQRTQRPTTKAGVPALQSKGASKGGSVEAYTAELEKLLEHPTIKNLSRIKELQAKLAEYGDN